MIGRAPQTALVPVLVCYNKVFRIFLIYILTFLDIANNNQHIHFIYGGSDGVEVKLQGYLHE